jgi:CP family cyanate transporter-like MFS transporter
VDEPRITPPNLADEAGSGALVMTQRLDSEVTAHVIDSEVKCIIEECFTAARDLLSRNRDKLEALTQALLRDASLDQEEILNATELPAKPGPLRATLDPGGLSSVRGARPVLAVVAILLVAFNLRLAVSAIPPILANLHLGAAGQSLLVTVPVLCFGLAALAGPWLRRRLGEEQLLLVVIAVLVLGLAIRAVWPQGGLFPGTVVAGLAVAIMNVVLPAVVRGRFAGHAAAMTSAYTVCLSVGSGLAAGLTVPILHATGSVQFALGVWALPAAVAFLVWLTQVTAWRPTVTHRQDASALVGAPRTRLWTSPVAWGVTGFFGLQSLVYYAVLSWLPSVYRARGDSPASAGLLLAILATTGIIGNLAGPALASRTKDQRLAVLVCISITSVGVVGVLLGPLSTAVLWACILGIGTGATFAVAVLLVVVRSANAATAVRLSAMAQGTGYVIAATGPLALGLVRAGSGSWTLPLVLILGALAVEILPGLVAARSRVVGLD